MPGPHPRGFTLQTSDLTRPGPRQFLTRPHDAPWRFLGEIAEFIKQICNLGVKWSGMGGLGLPTAGTSVKVLSLEAASTMFCGVSSYSLQCPHPQVSTHTYATLHLLLPLQAPLSPPAPQGALTCPPGALSLPSGGSVPALSSIGGQPWANPRSPLCAGYPGLGVLEKRPV